MKSLEEKKKEIFMSRVTGRKLNNIITFDGKKIYIMYIPILEVANTFHLIYFIFFKRKR